MYKNITISDCQCVMVVTILLRSEFKSNTNAIEYLPCFFTPITAVLLQSPFPVTKKFRRIVQILILFHEERGNSYYIM